MTCGERMPGASPDREKAAACGEREEQGGQPGGGRRWLREGWHGRSGARRGAWQTGVQMNRASRPRRGEVLP